MILMDGWDQVEEYIKVATNSSGQSMEKFEAYQDSITGKMEGMKNAGQELANNMLSSDLFGTAIDAGSTLLNVLNAIIDKTGALSAVLGLVSGTVLNKKGLGKLIFVV